MDRMHLIDILPIWAVFILTVAFGLLSVELGYRFGIVWKRRNPDEKETHIGAMVAATLGLWAFLLAFLVGIATDRYEARRALVVAEANSIGTTFLRAGYLPAPYANHSRELLEEYAGERLRLVERETFSAARQRSEEIHPLLWADVQEMVATHPINQTTGLYIDSLNQTIDLHAARVAALTAARLPITILIGMYLIAMFGLMMLGFQSAITGKRDLIVTLVMILVFSVVMLLIIDLDRSWAGFLRVNQQPMVDLINSFGNFK